jgi:hypothetical protein
MMLKCTYHKIILTVNMQFREIKCAHTVVQSSSCGVFVLAVSLILDLAVEFFSLFKAHFKWCLS